MREVEFDVPASALTSMGAGGTVDRLYRPAAAGDAVKLVDLAASEGIRPRILGGGTNLLIGDEGLRIPVISTAAMQGFRFLSGNRVRAEAGMPLRRLLVRSVERGLSGLEGLAGIPGSVGGAVFMNAGGGGSQIGDRVESVEVARPGRGIEILRKDRIVFGYRRTNLHDALILAVTFCLAPADPESLRERIRRTLEAKKRSQPQKVRSAGCFFKNPGKVPAGLLIDKSGCKGMRVGGAMVSHVHANFIVNIGGATAGDVMRLAADVREVVRISSGVRLAMEVKYWTNSARVAAKARAAAERMAECARV